MLENLWIAFANLGILYLGIWIAFLFVFILLLLLYFLFRCFDCSRAIKFLGKYLDKISDYCLEKLFYLGLIIFGILFILSFLTNKGIFANEFLGF